MKKEDSFFSWCWKGSCHDARFSIDDGNVGNYIKKGFLAEIMFFMPQRFELNFTSTLLL
jgi:hypothetical protein